MNTPKIPEYRPKYRCLFFHRWLLFIWKDKKHYGGHRAVRACITCGLKQEWNDPENISTTSSEKWIDANMGKLWQPTDLKLPTDPKKFNLYKGSKPKKIIHKGLSD
jgi:hypothetical protein